MDRVNEIIKKDLEIENLIINMTLEERLQYFHDTVLPVMNKDSKFWLNDYEKYEYELTLYAGISMLYFFLVKGMYADSTPFSGETCEEWHNRVVPDHETYIKYIKKRFKEV